MFGRNRNTPQHPEPKRDSGMTAKEWDEHMALMEQMAKDDLDAGRGGSVTHDSDEYQWLTDWKNRQKYGGKYTGVTRGRRFQAKRK